ncbi:hypothetical protein [Undibacterium pigrum]|uniref:Uncharacterized protein n=1 Tax=Undibacterium pigrum TaxID=401470 RepID=A0A318JAD0_9BURK|nr:hypothetical protein [Undibacterium pigrum]PXX45332.1 hypothetical protein DFR42_102560 [Undibacterium pigrum]
MHHIPGETLLSHGDESNLISANLPDKKIIDGMRTLSDEEVSSVAGGPEVHVETGGG